MGKVTFDFLIFFLLEIFLKGFWHKGHVLHLVDHSLIHSKQKKCLQQSIWPCGLVPSISSRQILHSSILSSSEFAPSGLMWPFSLWGCKWRARACNLRWKLSFWWLIISRSELNALIQLNSFSSKEKEGKERRKKERKRPDEGESEDVHLVFLFLFLLR